MYRHAVLLTAAAALLAWPASVLASADPGPADPDGVTPVAAAVAEIGPAVEAPPVADGRVASSPPSTTTLEGVTLAISARDETQMSVFPLTTAISTREYAVGGVFDGSITGSAARPEGILEVGYQIGCAIDMSTGGGVLLGASAGGTAVADVVLPGLVGSAFPAAGVVGVGGGVTGQIGVNLKPGIINIVPVTKKAYKGSAPEVEVSNFRVRIDGCVGESFIRSYATLSRSTGEVEDIASWFGVTKAV
ncbi:MAG: MspA family porin [Mycobacterium sp.]|nr:MspA family porin [Mycobacterium sp.]